jgi:hypothetical protein
VEAVKGLQPTDTLLQGEGDGETGKLGKWTPRDFPILGTCPSGGVRL